MAGLDLTEKESMTMNARGRKKMAGETNTLQLSHSTCVACHVTTVQRFRFILFKSSCGRTLGPLFRPCKALYSPQKAKVLQLESY